MLVDLTSVVGMYEALGKWCFKHWKIVIGIWVAVIVGILGSAGAAGPAFNGAFEIPESESRDGFDLLEEHFGGQGNGQAASIVFRTDLGVEDSAVMVAMSDIFDYTAALDEGVSVVSPYGQTAAPQISPDRNIAFAAVTIVNDIDQTEALVISQGIEKHVEETLEAAGLAEAVEVEIGGAILAEFEPPETELIGLAFAVVVLILAFGSVMAMGLPIGVAVAGVGTGIGLINLLSHTIAMPDFAIQIGAMIGLGVGIDYALFIVTRYRNALHDGITHYDAVGIAMDTAGRSVIFAGLTVVVSLLGMLLIGLAFITGLGVGAAVTVAVTMAASVTLLPAFLGLVGDKVELTRYRGLVAAGLVALGLLAAGLSAAPIALAGFAGALVILIAGRFIPFLNKTVPPRRQKPMRETGWYRWSRFIQSQPWIAAGVGVAILLVMATPVLSLRMGFSDEGNFPEETTTRKAYDLLADGFGPGFNGPFVVVAELSSPQDLGILQTLQQAIDADPGVATAAGPVPNNFENPQDSTAALIQVVPTNGPQDLETEELVKRLRDSVIPSVVGDNALAVNVTGQVPANIDFTSFLGQRIIVFFAVVLTLSFLLLMAVFRSLLVPVKAVIMNVLSIAAAYGVIVAVFQWGWFGSVLGIEPAPIEPFIPMMMFAIVFGLSMDYEVFLLSRIKEEYERTGDAEESVADGLASTARVITAAAAIMVVVFGSFMFEDNRIIKLFGIGLSTAVFLDATLVRMLLVPATMELLGERNWWLPKWLDKILPDLNIEGSGSHAEASRAAEVERVEVSVGGRA